MDYCKKCGHFKEITHFVLGKWRTHPCACLCEIKRYEKGTTKVLAEQIGRGKA